MQRWGRIAAGVTAALVAWSAASAAPNQAPGLDQGWKPEDRNAWYGASQGSRLIPLAWLRALEQPGARGGKFLDPTYLEQRYRYISDGGVNGLPVGFALDVQDDRKFLETSLRWRKNQSKNEPWVGMNCAACHTTKLRYNNKDYVIDGGATLADFQTLLVDLEAALSQTLADPTRFDRFARDVFKLPPGSPPNTPPLDTQANRTALRAAVAQHLRYAQDKRAMNKTNSKYGFGRLDAVGHILNKVVLVSNRKAPVAGAEPDAPVSYPFLWNVNQHEKVQWNGIAPNIKLPAKQDLDVGALVRNTSEVTGVFADIDTRWTLRGGYRTSANVKNLVSMEQLLGKLNAPKWPAEWPLDQTLVDQGAPLFKEHCSECHQLLSRKDLKTKIPLQMGLFKPTPKFPKPPGTDKAMACNAAMYVASTGSLKGAGEGYFNILKPLGKEEKVTTMLTTLTVGQLWHKRDDVAGAGLRSLLGLNPPPQVAQLAAPVAAKPTRRELCEDAQSDILGYKARPLNGIWATAPYLHNGSVATLYDLLLPPADRKAFYVGSREFDPINVGYVRTQTSAEDFFLNPFTSTGGPAWGDSNAGHDYNNAQFTPQQRRALVEYMKTFGER